MICSLLALQICVGGAKAAPQPTGDPPAIGFSDPALSPDGETLVFVYLGDLWSVPASGGEALRLTTHVDRESSPCFSPDGTRLAFSSDRWGNADLFVMPAAGGAARRLSYHEADEWVCDWSADGSEVLFAAARGSERPHLWALPAAGGDARRRSDYQAFDGALRGGGGALLASAGSSRWYRWGYRGSAAARIVLDAPGRDPRVLLPSETHDRWPLWLSGGEELLFVSSREGGIPNLYRAPVAGGEPRRLTDQPAPGVSFPTLDAAGRRAVFVREGRLFAVDLEARGGAARPLPVRVRSDDKETPLERVKTRKVDGGWDIDAAGEHLVAAFRGELFAGKIAPGDDDRPRRLTRSAGRDDQPRYSPDGEQIVFVSDAGGDRDIWVIDAEGRQPPRQLTDDPQEEGDPQWSAEGVEILFERGRGDLYLVPAAGGPARKVVSGPQVHTPHRSPAGDWAAYERHNAADVGDIFVVDLASGEEWNVSPDPAHDQRPRWSPDGRRLLFESDRDGSWDLFVLTMAELEAEEEDAKAGSEEGGSDSQDGEEEEAERRALDAELRRFLERGRFEPEKIASTAGDDQDAAWSEDAERVLFRSNVLGSWDLWSGDSKGGTPSQLTHDGANESRPRWIAGDRIAYASGGRVYTAPESGTARTAVELEARFTLDRRSLHEAVFDEAWRALREQFYDPELHGADWEAVRRRHSERLRGVWDRTDLQRLISEMMGALNASHLGIWGGGGRERTPFGYLGAQLVPVDGDFRAWRIASIVANGPLDPPRLEPGQERPRVGDHVVTWEGVHQPPGALLDTLLLECVDRPLELGLARHARRKAASLFTARPVAWGALRRLRTEARVEERAARVARASAGRIAYVYLSAMDRSNLRRFRQTLLGDAYQAEALIIDVRDNGGGYIHEELLQALDRGPYALRHPRGGERTLQPANWRRRPAAVLINERSGSDAEIFPEAFRALGLGPLVGVATAGSVIGTGGMKLLDGSWLRLPTVGWFTLRGQNLENRGVAPDVPVELTPADEAAGRDPQLQRAIERMLEAIGEPEVDAAAERGDLSGRERSAEIDARECAAGRCTHQAHRDGDWIDLESWN